MKQLILVLGFLMGSVFAQTSYEEFEYDTLTFSVHLDEVDVVESDKRPIPEDIMKEVSIIKSGLSYGTFSIEVSRKIDTISITKNHNEVTSGQSIRLISGNYSFDNYDSDGIGYASIMTYDFIGERVASLTASSDTTTSSTALVEGEDIQSRFGFGTEQIPISELNFKNISDLKNTELYFRISLSLHPSRIVTKGTAKLIEISPLPPTLSVLKNSKRRTESLAFKNYDAKGRQASNSVMVRFK